MRDEKTQIAALPNIVRHHLQVSNCSFSIRIFISKLIRKRNILLVLLLLEKQHIVGRPNQRCPWQIPFPRAAWRLSQPPSCTVEVDFDI
jgi:hypothetical protein